MTASSISTYLDVAQAAGQSRGPSLRTIDDESIERSAQVLAEIFKGTERATDIPENTDLTLDQVVSALGYLSESGLVDLSEAGGELTASLTEPIKTVLNRI